MSKIAVVGSGLVGLVTGSCFAELGHKVICVDNNSKKISELTDGQIPCYEPGLADLIERNVTRGALSFSTDVGRAVESSEVVFVSVATPPLSDGTCDLTPLNLAMSEIQQAV